MKIGKKLVIDVSWDPVPILSQEDSQYMVLWE